MSGFTTLAAVGLASGLLSAPAAGSERLMGTELRDNGEHRALFAHADGRIETLVAGAATGDCVVGSVRRRHVVLECPSGRRRVDLAESLAPRSTGARAQQAAVFDLSLPAVPFRRALADRQGVALEVAVEPAVKDGHLFGYRIAGIRPEGRFSGLGLQQGDVLMALNGAPVADPRGLMQVLRGLEQANAFECLIERDGQQRVHRYQLVD